MLLPSVRQLFAELRDFGARLHDLLGLSAEILTRLRERVNVRLVLGGVDALLHQSVSASLPPEGRTLTRDIGGILQILVACSTVVN